MLPDGPMVATRTRGMLDVGEMVLSVLGDGQCGEGQGRFGRRINATSSKASLF